MSQSQSQTAELQALRQQVSQQTNLLVLILLFSGGAGLVAFIKGFAAFLALAVPCLVGGLILYRLYLWVYSSRLIDLLCYVAFGGFILCGLLAGLLRLIGA